MKKTVKCIDNIVVAIDPGDHIGVVWRYGQEQDVSGLTLEGDDRYKQLWKLLDNLDPDVICYEVFALRQSAAMKLIGNRFITCEVIGTIKTYCQLKHIKLIELQPVNKQYCGFTSKPSDPEYKKVVMLPEQKITEHTRDAYRLLRYAMLFKDQELYEEIETC